MQIAEPTVTYKTIKDPVNMFGRQSRLNLNNRNVNIENNLFWLDSRSSGLSQDNVWKSREKLNQNQLPKSTFPKLFNDTADRFIPILTNNRYQSSLSESYSRRSRFPTYLKSQFHTFGPDLSKDPNYQSNPTKYFKSTNSFKN